MKSNRIVVLSTNRAEVRQKKAKKKKKTPIGAQQLTNVTILLGRRSRAGCIGAVGLGPVREGRFRPHQSDSLRSSFHDPGLLGRRRQGGLQFDHADAFVSWLEGTFHLTSLVVDPLGLYEPRENADLHRTLKVIPPEAVPSGVTHTGNQTLSL